MMELRIAEIADIDRIMEIMDDGRIAQRRRGFIQWADDYPDRSVIRRDIDMRAGRILTDHGFSVGYASLMTSDAEYDRLSHIWRLSGEYAVIHRMAVCGSCQGSGLSNVFFDLLEYEVLSRGIGIMRVDTGRENKIMQHILEKRRYTPLGLQNFSWGERHAYEKSL